MILEAKRPQDVEGEQNRATGILNETGYRYIRYKLIVFWHGTHGKIYRWSRTPGILYDGKLNFPHMVWHILGDSIARQVWVELIVGGGVEKCLAQSQSNF